MARGELFELSGRQRDDTARVDDGAGGAAAGTSHRAEARPPAAAGPIDEGYPVN